MCGLAVSVGCVGLMAEFIVTVQVLCPSVTGETAYVFKTQAAAPL